MTRELGGPPDSPWPTFVAARGRDLLRLAACLTGDPRRAAALTESALAEVRSRESDRGAHPDREAATQAALARLARLARTRPSTMDSLEAHPVDPDHPDGQVWAALVRLAPAERVAVVLTARLGWDSVARARALGVRRGVARADLTRALDRLRAVLPPRLVATAEDAELLDAVLSRMTVDLEAPLDLAGRVESRARRTRSGRRRVVAAAVASIAGLVVAVGLLAGVTPSGSSAPTSPTSPQPGGSVVAVPEQILMTVAQDRLLVAYDAVVLDGTSGTVRVVVDIEAATGASRGSTVEALARVEGGYVVRVASPDGGSELFSVRPGQPWTPLGRVASVAPEFAVSPDGRLVAHTIVGPVAGDNAVAAGSSELVVQALSGEVVNRLVVPGRARILAIDAARVWFDVGPPGPPSVWERETARVVSLDVPQGLQAVAVRGVRVLLRDEAAQCLVLVDVSSIDAPAPLWRRCGGLGAAAISARGDLVAVARPADSELVILDEATGVKLASAPLAFGRLDDLTWSADRVVVASSTDLFSSPAQRFLSVSRPFEATRRWSTGQAPADTGVVLGREAPVPAVPTTAWFSAR